MKIAKGIKGIKAFLKEDRSGWHLYINGTRHPSYFDVSLSEIIESFNDEYTLAGWAGNCLEIQHSKDYEKKVMRERYALVQVKIPWRIIDSWLEDGEAIETPEQFIMLLEESSILGNAENAVTVIQLTKPADSE